jgi:hypothetical protein
VQKVNYRDISAMIAAQKAELFRRIEVLSNFHVVHPGVDFAGRDKLSPADIPGVCKNFT